MARVKHYLLVSVAAAALATSAAAPARAQYHYYKSEKPNVEIDLGALSGGALAPTAPPQQDADGHAPPVVLRQPLPPAPPAAPVAAGAPASDEPATEETPMATAAQAPMPAAAPAAGIQPRRVVKPLFSEPVAPPPALREAAPATPVAAPAAEPLQIEPQLTAAPAAEPSGAPVALPVKAAAAPAPADMPPAKLMAPILEPMPAAAMHPLRKPARASVTTNAAPKPIVDTPASANAADNSAAPVAASAVKSAAPSAPSSAGRMSYPPAARPAADIQRFERPVLPEGLRADEQAAPLRQAAPLTAPATDISAPAAEASPAVDSKAAQELTAPAEHSPAPQAAMTDLPVRKPYTEELPQTVLSDNDMAALPDTAVAPEMKLDSQASYHRAPADAETTEAPAANMQPPAAPQAQRPSLVVVDTAAPAVGTLPRRQPVTTTLDAPEEAPQTVAAPAAKSEASEPAAKRESLMPLTEDEAEALLATRPAPKPVENIRPPLTAAELEKASRNIEAVPARVALAPPAPQPKDIGVPTMADLTLEFAGTSSDLTPETQQKLVNIIPLLQESKARRLAVHAYAAGEDGSKTSARRISLSRALAVRSFLMDNGVEPTRVDVRALGLETDRKPLERVDLVFAR